VGVDVVVVVLVDFEGEGDLNASVGALTTS
jgi:hypothetical protein